MRLPNRRGVGPSYDAANAIEANEASLEDAARAAGVTVQSVVRALRHRGRRVS